MIECLREKAVSLLPKELKYRLETCKKISQSLDRKDAGVHCARLSPSFKAYVQVLKSVSAQFVSWFKRFDVLVDDGPSEGKESGYTGTPTDNGELRGRVGSGVAALRTKAGPGQLMSTVMRFEPCTVEDLEALIREAEQGKPRTLSVSRGLRGTLGGE